MNLSELLEHLKIAHHINDTKDGNQYVEYRLDLAIALVEAAIAEGPVKPLDTLAAEQGVAPATPEWIAETEALAPDGMEDFEKRKAPDWRALADKAADIIFAYRIESECCVMCKETRWGVHKEGCEAYGVLQAIRAAEAAERGHHDHTG